LKPRHTARILGGQNPKKKNVLSIFRKNWSRANPKCKEHFFFLVSAKALRGGGGAFLRAYDLVSLHHALRACDIICFENRFELGTINTPIQNGAIFQNKKWDVFRASHFLFLQNHLVRLLNLGN
jgi:hypothetical protein